MAGIQTAIQLNDRVTAPLIRIYNQLEKTNNQFRRVEKSADFGKVSSQVRRTSDTVTRLSQNTRRAATEQQNYNNKVNQSANSTNKLLGRVKGLVVTYLSLHAVVSTIKNAVSAAGEFNQANTKLTEIMRARQGANNSTVQGVQKLIAETANAGVVGKTALTNGAQQVSTYFRQTEAVKKLIPKMADLAVQMHGTNASSEDMVNIGNMFGKVMTGQVGALRRAGISFDKNQEAAMKNGNEMQKAAMLAKVVEQNVGHMNATMTQAPEGKFAKLRNQLKGLYTTIGVLLIPCLANIAQTITNNMPTITGAVQGFAKLICGILNALAPIVELVGIISNAIGSNWPQIEPIVYTAVGAFVALKIAMWATTAANDGLIASMLANPLTWLIVLLGVIIALIYRWTQSVGGIHAAWLIFTNGFLYLWDSIVIACTKGVFAVMNFGDKLKLYWIIMWNALLDTVGRWKVTFLVLIQAAVNGAIKAINSMINGLNKLPFVNIKTIGEVKFGTEAAAQEEANRQQRAAKAASVAMDVKRNQEARAQTLKQAYSDRDNRMITRDAEIRKVQAAAKKAGKDADKYTGLSNKYRNGGAGSGKGSDAARKIADNTSAIKDSLDITSENIKYIKDLATDRAVNRYTSTEIKVDMTNNNSLSGTNDVDGIVAALKTKIESELYSSAEGVHA